MLSTFKSLEQFYAKRRVLVTGHSGFKGGWLALWLERLGAHVFGISLPPEAPLGIYTAAGLGGRLPEEFTDVRKLPELERAFSAFRPELVFHLAAQPLVGVSYDDPAGTFATNLMGTVNVLECIRRSQGVQAAVLVTTDKCYENVDQLWGYRESDRLGGADPYSSSKACAELAIAAYARSFFSTKTAPHLASARAGNVVGGGDWATYRIIPDCARALRKGEPIELRNPGFTRPWQHVLDSLWGYLMLGLRLTTEGEAYRGAWNFGPSLEGPEHTVEEAAKAVVSRWGGGEIKLTGERRFHEASRLQLDCSKAHKFLHWRTAVDFEQALALTADWYLQQHQKKDGEMREYSLEQLASFEAAVDRVTTIP